MPHLIIYRANLADLELVRQTGIETYTPYYPHVWKPGGMDWYMEHCFGRESLARELSDEHIEYYLPQTPERQIIGLLKIHPNRSLPHDADTTGLYVEKLYLMPAFFRKGMGQELLNVAEDMAKALHHNTIWLQVMQTGPVSAYTKAGYQIAQATRFEFDYLKEEERNGWVMVKQLPKPHVDTNESTT